MHMDLETQPYSVARSNVYHSTVLELISSPSLFAYMLYTINASSLMHLAFVFYTVSYILLASSYFQSRLLRRHSFVQLFLVLSSDTVSLYTLFCIESKHEPNACWSGALHDDTLAICHCCASGKLGSDCHSISKHCRLFSIDWSISTFPAFQFSNCHCIHDYKL